MSSMVFYLSSRAVRVGYRVEVFDRVDSTNLLAAEFAGSGDQGKLWVVAREQTSGKGRRGRDWVSPPGNLYATLLLIDNFAHDKEATLGFVAGISLIDALQHSVPESVLKHFSVALKWPNDILVNGAKLAGILLELLPLNKSCRGILVGIGVNVIASPADLPYPTADLRSIGADCTSAVLFRALSRSWIDNYSMWNGGLGLDAVRDKWLQYAANLEQRVHFIIDGRVVSGIFETIDRNCHFVLRKDDGQKITIPAGDVHFGSVASVRPDSDGG